MDNLSDLEKILAAARDLGKNLQSDAEKLRAENKKLIEENRKLLAENEKLKGDSDSLLEEVDTLENAMKDFRSANETFIINIDKLMKQLNAAINSSHEKFMAQINALMRDEFQKFLLEYMNKVKPNKQNPADKKSPQKNSPDGKKKSNEQKDSTDLVKVNASGEVIFSEPETSDVANAGAEKKSKEIYAEFYAEETVPK